MITNAVNRSIVICGTAMFPVRRVLDCPVCKRRRRHVVEVPDSPWYGPEITCCGCGDSWTDGELRERPFVRGWRKRAIASAKRTWVAAGQYTKADYRAWRDNQLRPLREDES